MNKTIIDLLYKRCLVYLDDINIWGNTPEEINATVIEVSNRLANIGLKLNGEKSVLLTKKIEVLGHHITEGTMTP